MKNNTFNKLREFKRMWDFADFHTQTGKKVVKKRAHKRSRQQLKVNLNDLENVV